MPLTTLAVQWVLANPVSGIVQLNRLALTGHAAYVGTALAITACWLVGLVVLTLASYCRYERVACDRL